MTEETPAKKPMSPARRASLFAAGNQFHKLAYKNLGRKKLYSDPKDLVKDIVKWFDWLEANPLQEAKLVSFQGESALEDVPKLRAPTLHSLCAFLGITRSTWGVWRRREDLGELADVVQWAEDIMYSIKFEGASAGLLNPNIIARDLGLAEKTELTGKDGGPLESATIDMTKLDTDTLRSIMAAKVKPE